MCEFPWRECATGRGVVEWYACLTLLFTLRASKAISSPQKTASRAASTAASRLSATVIATVVSRTRAPPMPYRGIYVKVLQYPLALEIYIKEAQSRRGVGELRKVQLGCVRYAVFHVKLEPSVQLSAPQIVGVQTRHVLSVILGWDCNRPLHLCLINYAVWRPYLHPWRFAAGRPSLLR